jgi:hypothetical protein
MPDYEVWTSNEPAHWTLCHLETDDRLEAQDKAQALVDSCRFRFVAIDHNGKTIWSNDPDTPAESDLEPFE